MASQPKSSAIRTAATYILHCSRICASVRSVEWFGPVWNFIPRFSIHARTASASASGTRIVSAKSADWLSRSLKTPHACSAWSGMMALNIPMQPSSNTPMIAFPSRSCAASCLPSFAARAGTFTFSIGRACDVSCVMRPVFSHCRSFARKNASVKSSLHSVE